MNSLLLFLFLGASVALAELPFEHPDFVEFLNEESHEEILGELNDEENDPHHDHHHHHHPSGTPPVLVVSLVCVMLFLFALTNSFLVIVTFRKPLVKSIIKQVQSRFWQLSLFIVNCLSKELPLGKFLLSFPNSSAYNPTLTPHSAPGK